MHKCECTRKIYITSTISKPWIRKNFLFLTCKMPTCLKCWNIVRKVHNYSLDGVNRLNIGGWTWSHGMNNGSANWMLWILWTTWNSQQQGIASSARKFLAGVPLLEMDSVHFGRELHGAVLPKQPLDLNLMAQIFYCLNFLKQLKSTVKKYEPLDPNPTAVWTGLCIAVPAQTTLNPFPPLLNSK